MLVLVGLVFALGLSANIALAQTTITLSGTVKDNLANPFPGAKVQTTAGTTFTDSSGYYTLSIPPGTYDVNVVPPEGSGFGPAVAPGQVLTNDTILNFVLVPLGVAALSGQLLDPDGNGIANEYINLAAWGTDNWIMQRTDASGGYFFEVAAGDYKISIGAYGGISPNAPRYFYLYTTAPLSLTQSMTMNITLPEKRVSVHVQGPAGNPVANVGLTTTYICNNLPLGTLPANECSGYYSNAPATTNASGDAVLWLFPNGSGNTYTFTATPPADSPFVTFNVYDVNVVSDMTIIIVLQFVHAPPVTNASISPPPDPQGAYPDPATIALSATATPGFTVAATYYSVDGGSTQTYSTPFVVSGDGTHTVRYWSVDNIGVSETPKTLTIEIISNRPPVAACQNVTVAASSSCAANASINNGSYDPDGGQITLAQSPPGPYLLGNTPVILTVTDSKGASSQCTATVTMVDTTPPTVTVVSVTPSVLWPPNHKMVLVTLAVSKSDNCDPNPLCRVTLVSSNEPENGLGDGDTAPDWKITGNLTVNLRAERSGTGNGRIYTITINCTDGVGNSSSQSVMVTVPHDQGKK